MIDNKYEADFYRRSIGDKYFTNLKLIMDFGMVVKPRGKEIRELVGSQLVGRSYKDQLISIPGVRDVADPETNEGKYLIAELFWYFSGSRTPDFIGNWGSLWKKIANKDGTLNSNYGRAVFYDKIGGQKLTKFDWAAKTLIDDPDSRQAIIPYTRDSIFTDQCAGDFTCTQLQHFFIRGNFLHSVVYIRSSDAIFGLNYDIPFWSVAQQMMLLYLRGDPKFGNLKLGDLTVFIGSSHVYETHYDLVNRILKAKDEYPGNPYKSLEVLPEAISFPVQNIGALKLIIDLRKDLVDKLGLAGTSMEEKIFSIVPTKDNEDECEVVPMSALAHAKGMMHLFRIANFINPDLGKDKDFWMSYVKKWFDLFFKVTG